MCVCVCVFVFVFVCVFKSPYYRRRLKINGLYVFYAVYVEGCSYWRISIDQIVLPSYSYVTWYCNGIAISSEILEVPGLSVQSTPSSVHENTIKLRSTSIESITDIVHCTIEGIYRDNIVNIYKLNKETPRGQ